MPLAEGIMCRSERWFKDRAAGRIAKCESKRDLKEKNEEERHRKPSNRELLVWGAARAQGWMGRNPLETRSEKC